MAVLTLAGFLAVHEIGLLINPEVKSEIIFENLRMNDLQVYIDVDILKVPCEFVDLKFTAKKGRQHSVRRIHLFKDRREGHLTEMTELREAKDLIGPLKSGSDGCKVEGIFYMHFLSNLFNIEYGNHHLLAKTIKQAGGNIVLDLSHRVVSLKFGPSGANEELAL